MIIRQYLSMFPSRYTFMLCLLFFVFALAERGRANRIATNPAVMAEVKGTWFERGGKGGQVQFAHLVFDRTQDGRQIHCDVNRVNINLIGKNIDDGEHIKIAPLSYSCFEPDIICDSCPSWQTGMTILLLSSAISGILFGFLLKKEIADYTLGLKGPPRLCLSDLRPQQHSADRSSLGLSSVTVTCTAIVSTQRVKTRFVGLPGTSAK